MNYPNEVLTKNQEVRVQAEKGQYTYINQETGKLIKKEKV